MLRVALLSPALAGRWQKVHINFETFLKYIFGTLPNRCYAHALTEGAGRLNCERGEEGTEISSVATQLSAASVSAGSSAQRVLSNELIRATRA